MSLASIATIIATLTTGNKTVSLEHVYDTTNIQADASFVVISTEGGVEVERERFTSRHTAHEYLRAVMDVLISDSLDREDPQ